MRPPEKRRPGTIPLFACAGLPAVIALVAIVTAGSGGAVARATATAARSTARSDAAKPNIILIVTDDQDLLLGSLDVMPQVHDLLATAGTTFSHAFVPLSLCCPSRAAILTGRYAHNLQIYTNAPPDGGFPRFHALGLEAQTIGVAMQRAGYRTSILGKYLNDYPDSVPPTYMSPGWDEWVVPSGGSPYTEFNYTLNQNGTQTRFGRRAADYMTDILARRARRFIAKAAADNAPFFLYLTPYAPHKPCTPAPRHSRLFPGVKAPRTPSFNEADVSDKPAAIRDRPLLSAAEIAAIDRLYRLRLQSLQAVDETVGSLVGLLERTGQLDNTYIFFTSDNGFHMGQHRLLSSKYTSYEEDIRVPLIVRGPGVPAGQVVDALTENVDLAPTIAALGGATLPAQVDGRSLVPWLTGGAPLAHWRRQVLLEQFQFVDAPEGTAGVLEPSESSNGQEYPTHLGLRTATFKFVSYATGESEYYDLVNDPYELQNLAQQLNGTLLRQLTDRVKALVHCKGRTCRDLEAAPVAGL